MTKNNKRDAEAFCHLHCHSDLSKLDGCGRIEDYVREAKERGNPAIAFTEHGSMRGYLQLREAAEKHEIKPIYGIEFYVSRDMHRKGLTDVEKAEITKGKPKSEHRAALKAYEEQEGIRDRWHTTVWAMNDRGMRNLQRLSSSAWIDGFYYQPRVDLNALIEHNEGLAISTGCLNGPANDSYLQGKERFATAFVEDLQAAYGDRMYLEVQPHAIADQAKTNLFAAKKLKDRTKAKLLATQDAHYVYPGDDKAHEVLLCLGTGAKMSDPNRFKFDGDEFYFRTRKQMFNAFRRHHDGLSKSLVKEALDTTVELAERCDVKVEIDYMKALLPEPEVPSKYDGDSFRFLRDLCLDGWTWRTIPARARAYAQLHGISSSVALRMYADRLKDELKTLKRQRFIPYFLLVRDLYSFARGKGIFCGPGRGSAGGSLIAFLLGITAIDPIEHGLLFERFINPDRHDLPDIDMDFEDARRHEVVTYLIEKHGRDKVCQIATVGKLSGKSVLRDVSRVLGVPLAAVNEISPSIIERPDGHPRQYKAIEDSFAEFDVCKRFDREYPEVQVFAKKLEGMTKVLGIHAAGVVTSPVPLVEVMPLEVRTSKDEKIIVSAIDMNEIASLGLVKLDVLGLRTLTVIRDAVSAVKERHKVDLDMERIATDDAKVLQRFTEQDFSGVFQYDTPSAYGLCKGLSFEHFEDIAALAALNRPGPKSSGLAEKYLSRKKNPKKRHEVDYHPLVNKVCADTLGVIVYQEHIIRLAVELAGFTPGEADSLRKAIGKKKAEELKAARKDFVRGCERKSDMSRDTATKLFDAIEAFGQYGFNKCVSGDTEVILCDDHIGNKTTKITISDLYVAWKSKGEERRHLMQLDGDNVMRPGLAKIIHPNGVKPVFLLTTIWGRTIKITSNHKLLTVRGYRSMETPIDALRPGSVLMCMAESGLLVRDEVTTIQLSGIEEVFDVEMSTVGHNFVANTIVSHNSHATAYATISYWGQYLKTYYPTEFFWALLKNEPDRDRVKALAKDAKRAGIKLLNPHVSYSRDVFSIDPHGNIRGSLVDIKGVGDKAAATVMAHQPFTSMVDFAARIDRRQCNRGAINSLLRAGAFRGLVPNQKYFEAELPKVWAELTRKKVRKAEVERIWQAAAAAPDYTREERLLAAGQVNPLAFGDNPLEAYQKFVDEHVKVRITKLSDETLERLDGQAIYTTALLLDARTHQIGDFHTGELPSEEERKRQFWGARYANVNSELPSGMNIRVRFDLDVFESHREITELPSGGAFLVFGRVDAKYRRIAAHFAIDLERFRKRVRAGESLDFWERIVAGGHPASVYEWSDPVKAEARRFNTHILGARTSRGIFTGVVTHVRRKFDQRGGEMAFFGLLGERGFVHVIAFASTWPEIKKVVKRGRLLSMQVERSRGGGTEYVFNGGAVRVLKKLPSEWLLPA